MVARLLTLVMLAVTTFSTTSYARPQPWGLWFETKSGPPNPLGVVVDYLKAFEDCDVQGMMKLQDPDFKLFMASGTVVHGEEALGKHHHDRCKHYDEGGYGGLKIVPSVYSRDGNAVSYSATVTAPFIRKGSNYTFSEAVIARGNKIASIVSSMDMSKFDFTVARK